MRDALLTFDLTISAKWLLQKAPADQNIRENRETRLVIFASASRYRRSSVLPCRSDN